MTLIKAIIAGRVLGYFWLGRLEGFCVGGHVAVMPMRDRERIKRLLKDN